MIDDDDDLKEFDLKRSCYRMYLKARLVHDGVSTFSAKLTNKDPVEPVPEK